MFKYLAIEKNQLNAVKYFIENSNSNEIKSNLNETDESSKTPLIKGNFNQK
jgi:hypothetical protein